MVLLAIFFLERMIRERKRASGPWRGQSGKVLTVRVSNTWEIPIRTCFGKLRLTG